MFTKLTSQAKNLLYFLEVKTCRKKNTIPRSILFPVIWVTNKCNLKCKMCDQWKTDPALFFKEISTKEWFTFIDSVSRMHAAAIVITGGEPLLREDIFDIIRYIRSKGIACHVCSNGTLLNKFAVEKLGESGLNSISISLDSCYAEIHNKMRGAECFDNIIEGIKLLRHEAPKIKVGINYVITKLNFRELCRMIPFAESLGADQIKFDIIHTNLMYKQKLHTSSEGLLFDKSDIDYLRQELNNLIKAISKTKLLTNSSTFIKGISKLGNGGALKQLCHAGYISCAVDPFGYVSPCDGFDGEISLRNRPFEEIWTSGSFQELRRLVNSCKSRCWDTTHAELNIRCSSLGFLKELPQIFREMRFYLD